MYGSDCQRLVFIDARSRAEDFRDREKNQPINDREDVHVWPGVEPQAVGEKVGHHVGVRRVHDQRPPELSGDDGNGNPADSSRVGGHEGPAVAERAEYRSELVDDEEGECEHHDETEKGWDDE